VETATGRKVWSQGLKKSLGGASRGYGYCESPLVDGDQVVATPGGKKGAIAAFDKKTGKLKWRGTTYSTRDRPYYSSLIAIESSGVRQYVHVTYYSTRSIAGVRASDGKLLWKSLNDDLGGTISTPIYQNDCVYASSMQGCQLIKLLPAGDKFAVEEIYSTTEMKNHLGGIILLGEHIYGSSNDGWLCQDFKTGKVVWKKDPRLGPGSLTFADGNLYCYHQRGGDVLLIKATPAGYQERGRFRISQDGTKIPRGQQSALWTRPVVANGKLYLRDQDLIFCYDVRKTQ
jgi:outer membrane protein assembly factor BamB